MSKQKKVLNVSSIKSESLTELNGVSLVNTLRGHTGHIGRIAWSPDGHYLATPSIDGSVRVWNSESGTCKYSLRESGATVFAVAFDPSGKLLASASGDGLICIWDTSTGQRLYKIKDHEVAYSVAFSPDGQIFTSSGIKPKTRIRSVRKDKEIREWTIRLSPEIGRFVNDEVIQVVTNSRSSIFAFASHRSVVFVDINSGAALSVIDLTIEDKITAIALDPLGRVLATANADGTAKLWDVQRGRLIRSLEGHTSFLSSIAFSSDGKLLATKGGLRDHTVRIWRVDNGLCVAKLPERASSSLLTGVAFHPFLPLLASVGSEANSIDANRDCIIHIWKLDPELLRSQESITSISYTSAKIVLVGESNVGKSWLALRIAENRPPTAGEIKSTHGMKVWNIAPEKLSPKAVPPPGERRDVILWDMGGQEEYQLVHQLFLHDSTLALVLFDPTRGARAFEEIEAWNSRLEKQLRGRLAVKLLVGAKLDQDSETVDCQALDRLLKTCGFTNYYPTSALTDRGINELREAIADAINWKDLAKTSRPELFQRIRDEIENRRTQGQVVLHLEILKQSLSAQGSDEEEDAAVDAVTRQLAAQGVLVRSRLASGEPVMVLQIERVERYASSLIVAARNNPRGVPALDLQAIAYPDFSLPGISDEERLTNDQERALLECTVQLLLEHGVCFQHEGLLIFPSLFAPSLGKEESLPGAISICYDFSGAIDNIYASLVAWLVLARDFGRVRLSPNRAEFEVEDQGRCGLRKVGRASGFARVDIYFDENTPQKRRTKFISFVEEHLRQHGVEIREHLALTCTCAHKIEEETIRKRISRGEHDVICPICETRHVLSTGAAESRQQDPKLADRTWALKTEVEKRKQETTRKVVEIIDKVPRKKEILEPIRLLHLSDLHFTDSTSVKARLQWLIEDLQKGEQLGLRKLDYLVISGDFTDKGNTKGFERAYEFVSGLTGEFSISAERCIFVPGNHDAEDMVDTLYRRRKDTSGLKEGEYIQIGNFIMARDPEKYPLRFKMFSDSFYHKFLQRPYPLDYAEQGLSIPFWETGIQFLTLNSCWQIDDQHRKRAGIHPEAVAHALNSAHKQEDEARKAGRLSNDSPMLRIAVWHHSVTGHEQMRDDTFLGHLKKRDVKLILHGDVHEARRDLVHHWEAKHLHVIGSGSFSASATDRPESTPRMYNLLEIHRDLKSIRVHTREQRKPDGSWKGWNEWPLRGKSGATVPYYDLVL